MIVFKGNAPVCNLELSHMLRGINDSFCFYDDLSLREQCKVDKKSYILALIRKVIK